MTATFYEIQLPTNFSYGAHGGYGWLTHVVSTQAGYEYRSQQWAIMRGRWTVGHNLRQEADWQTLMNFFVSMQGRASGWRFKDWNDFTDWGNGTVELNPGSELQLCKTYQAPAPVVGDTQPSFTRWISKPVPGTITCAGATIDYTTGLVSGVEAGATWTGQFDVPARFDSDTADGAIEQPAGTSEDYAVASTWADIPVVELRIQPGNASG